MRTSRTTPATLVALVAGLAMLVAACAPGATLEATVTLGVEVAPVFTGVIHTVRVPRGRPSGGIVVRAGDGTRFTIPPGHYPPPGRCRVWRPERPPGQQDRPGSCRELERRVPSGAYLVYG